MKLLEYEAKKILRSFSVPVPRSTLEKNPSFASSVVLKSQVPTGGRGKLGGIKVVNSTTDYEFIYKSILQTSIKSFLPYTILTEEALKIQKEYYLSLFINREESTIQLLGHSEGGIDIEQQSKASFLTINLPASSSDLDKLSEVLGIVKPNIDRQLREFVANLTECFRSRDATLIEVNPLVLTTDDKLVAGDCKMELDDAASFRHPEWSDFQHPAQDTNFVELDRNGSVATIANGAGLAMATVDAVTSANLSAANFLDIGGGADEASVTQVFEKLSKNKNIQAIVVNIFAGITRCDEVAKAIIASGEKITNLPPLFIRLSGTNSDIANHLLDEVDIRHFDSLADCIENIKEQIS